ncbi:hypothetical protein M3J09_010985 [Ascochyta lentis]
MSRHNKPTKSGRVFATVRFDMFLTPSHENRPRPHTRLAPRMHHSGDARLAIGQGVRDLLSRAHVASS